MIVFAARLGSSRLSIFSRRWLRGAALLLAAALQTTPPLAVAQTPTTPATSAAATPPATADATADVPADAPAGSVDGSAAADTDDAAGAAAAPAASDIAPEGVPDVVPGVPAAANAAPGLAAADADSYAAVRGEFQQAYAAARADDAGAHDSAALQAYPLYPYLQAQRLRLALRGAVAQQAAADAAVAAFIGVHGGEVVSRYVYRQWLDSLGDRQQWTLLLKYWREDLANPALRCQQLRARIAEQHAPAAVAEISAAVKMRWLDVDDRSAACEPAYAWLRARGGLGVEPTEARARRLLEIRETAAVKPLLKQLPAARAAPLQTWLRLLEQPAPTLDELIAHPQQAVEAAALLAGFTRLAARNVDEAIARYEPLRRAGRLDAAQSSLFARTLALRLALNRRSEAVDWYGRVSAGDFDDLDAEWYVRAALWSGDWVRTRQALAHMPAALRDDARWQYWQARAAQQAGQGDTARKLYEGLAGDDGYYAALAAARLGHGYTPHAQPVLFDAASVAAVAAEPAFVRAHELLRCEMKSQASLEWLHGLQRLTAAQRRQAIALAYRWGWYEQAVATAAKQGIYKDYSLLYPQPYSSAVQSAAAASGISENFLYGILRQESLYRRDAVSHAGALGLLQLLPETAARAARRIQQPLPGRSALFEPQINLRLGAEELRAMIEHFAGQPLLAIAAYNAGPGAAKRWLPAQAMDADVWIENIPYNETRSYVQRVLWHRLVFAWVEKSQPQRLDTWLQPVTPLNLTTEGAR